MASSHRIASHRTWSVVVNAPAGRSSSSNSLPQNAPDLPWVAGVAGEAGPSRSPPVLIATASRPDEVVVPTALG